MKKYPDTTLVGVFPVKGTLLFDGSPMVYVFPQYMAVYRTECDTEEKFDRVYLFDEHVNSSTVEFDEELFEHGDSERGYYEDNAPLVASQYYGHEPMAYTVIDMQTFAQIILGHVIYEAKFKNKDELLDWLPELVDDVYEELRLHGLKIKGEVKAYIKWIEEFDELEDAENLTKEDVVERLSRRA
ncbi:hypothetical protein EEL51_10735 [Muribaculaceae bacterium Isolate-110 (HZI)]|uniref:hypothetical protein n=1 Tax=uncultured Duncaniella sp. TaxID=2768039 RepID=UPI000F4A01AB|nr:hypothetical protein [uncultured Duncaniella sp.]ROT18069.1 hypothetical protein EEL51_10735 [Muribaculaceae bacterium Isolate-110 (HZI)]